MDKAFWLPKVVAHADVSPDAVRSVHVALQRLPRPVCDLLWEHGVGVSIRASFPWDGETRNGNGHLWRESGGYWNEATGYAVLNASWMKGQADIDAVVIHELGHALSIRVLGKPHREPAFRAAWSTGRERVKRRWPGHYLHHNGLGVFCGHWMHGVEEVWAESFAWLMDARATTHPDFGEAFAECVDLVREGLPCLKTGEVAAP